MDDSGGSALLLTAASIGVVHTLLGPDHYLPFVALARARRWTLTRTLGVTAVCGVGHVLGSLLLGALGIGLGWTLGGLAAIESRRGALAGWLLLGVGIAYAAWGARQAMRDRPHEHVHAHEGGVVHRHAHAHRGEHAHPHAAAGRWLGPWSLFVVFVLGPCEPLVPLLMASAATRQWLAVSSIAVAFAAATVATMMLVVTVGALGLSRLPRLPWERWSHALAGAALTLCGVAILYGL